VKFGIIEINENRKPLVYKFTLQANGEASDRSN